MMVNATDISEQADEAVVHAQQLAACRALGIGATAGSSTTLGSSLVPSSGPPIVLAAVLATAVVVVGAGALSFLVLRQRM